MSAPRRPPRRQVDGVLLLDKPAGPSSNQALQQARRLFNAEKAGHTGTLDPFATGLLPVCFGEATKFSADLFDADKRYVATARLGETTDTGDNEGHVVQRRDVAVSDEAIECALAAFRGDITQIPPMYSALKRDGKPLYAYAREGIALEREARAVRIAHLQLMQRKGNDIVFDVTCSKGTYIRVLAQDIGEALGCGAHLVALRRVGVGALSIADAVTLEALQALDTDRRDACLQPPDCLVATLPRVQLSDADTARLLHGQPVAQQGEPAARCRLFAPEGRFLGIGRWRNDGLLAPDRLIRTGMLHETGDQSQKNSCAP